MEPTKTTWVFQPLWKILVKIRVFPNFRDENNKYLKPPPRKMSRFLSIEGPRLPSWKISTELPLPVVGKLQHVAIRDPPSHPWVAPKIEEPPETSTLVTEVVGAWMGIPGWSFRGLSGWLTHGIHGYNGPPKDRIVLLTKWRTNPWWK